MATETRTPFDDWWDTTGECSTAREAWDAAIKYACRVVLDAGYMFSETEAIGDGNRNPT